MTAPTLASRGSSNTALALGCGVLFLLPFAGFGVFATVQALRAAATSSWAQAGFFSIFALTFGGVGFGGLAALAAGRRRLADADTRQARNPDAPWLWRADWASGVVTDSSKAELWTAWVFAALWNLISVPSGVLGVREGLRQGNRLAFLALLFPAIGVGLLVWAARATLRYRRYGVSRFALAANPGVVGHTLAGTVRTPSDLRPPEGFDVVLSCIRRETTGSGKNRSTTEHLLWQEQRRTTGGPGGLPVTFAIPSDASPSDPGMATDRVLWRLRVTAEVPGIDYAAAFEVPVFRTAASDAPLTDADRAAAALAMVPADYRQPAGSRIQVSTTRRGTEIYFPPARNPGFAIGITVFAAIWLGAIALMLVLHAPIVFPIVFGLFALLLVYFLLEAWLGVTRVTAGDGQVTIANGWLVPGRERTLRAGEIKGVTTRIASQQGTTPFYDITIDTTAGERVAAGRSVRDKHEAEWLAATIAKAIAPR
ncbi:MAG TPA: hypothetical protein VJQ46_13455 [Gemmatimonadales bacterium]|nr:hypothetical protein [Gemmatimonadales bacterium]